MSAKPTLLASRFQFAITLGENLLLVARKFRVRRHITDGAVKTHFVVMADVPINDATSVLDRLDMLLTNTVALDRAVVTFNLTVALRIVWRRSYMRHARDPNRAPTEGWSL